MTLDNCLPAIRWGDATSGPPKDLQSYSLCLPIPARAVRPAISTWLRNMLAAVTGDDPKALLFDQGPHGKPHLVDANGVQHPPSFNLSHSGQLAALVMSSLGRPVGIDVEIPRRGRDLRRMADGFLSASEQRHLCAVPEVDVQAWLLRRWSAKEALAKAWGLGLSAGLHRIEIMDDSQPAWRASGGLQPPPGQWQLAELLVPGGFGWLAWDPAPNPSIALVGPAISDVYQGGANTGAEANSEAGEHRSNGA